MSPLVPGFATQPARIEATLAAMADLDVPLLGGNVLYLEDGSRDHFLQFLEAQAPHLLEKYGRLYLQKYPDPTYTAQVKGVLAALRARYDAKRRTPESDVRRQTDWIAGSTGSFPSAR